MNAIVGVGAPILLIPEIMKTPLIKIRPVSATMSGIPFDSDLPAFADMPIIAGSTMNLLLLTVAARIARRIENDCHQCGVQNSQIVPASEFDQFEKHPLLRAVSQWLRKATALSINLLAPACRSRRTSRSTLSDCSRAALEAILHT
jgi:hypothetical protein